MDRAKKTRFSITSKTVYGSGDVIMISKKQPIKEDIKYILAWLNSECIRKWYEIKGSKKGHRIQYTQAYVSKIPLKLINWNNKEEVDIYNEIVTLVSELISGNMGNEEKIDLLISKLIK